MNFFHLESGERDLVLLRHEVGIEWPDNRKVKHAVHEGYLLSKNSFVTIGVSKFKPFSPGTTEQNLSKRRRTLREHAYANFCGRLKDCI